MLDVPVRRKVLKPKRRVIKKLKNSWHDVTKSEWFWERMSKNPYDFKNDVTKRSPNM